MVMAVRADALRNADSPMDVSWLPAAKVMVSRLLAPLNVFAAIDLTPAGMVIVVRDLAL